MEINTVLWVAGLLAIALAISGAFKYSSKKKERGTDRMVIGAVVAVVAFGLIFGVFAQLGVAPVPDAVTPADLIHGVTNGACVVKPYTNVSVSISTWGTGATDTGAGNLNVYLDGVDPRDTQANTFATFSVTAGEGSSSTTKLMSCTPYVVLLDGDTTKYDMFLNDIEVGQHLPYIPTTEASISQIYLQFADQVTFSTIPDPVEENSVTGIINGQTNVSGLISDGQSLEVRVGADNTPADSDVIYYNETHGNGDFYLDITLGAEDTNTMLKDPVIAFANDFTYRMEGNEFEKVELQHQSGRVFAGLPTDITTAVNSWSSVPLTTDGWLEAGQTGVYRITFSVNEDNTDPGADLLHIYTDDLDEEFGQDVLRGTKATAGAVIDIGFQA